MTRLDPNCRRENQTFEYNGRKYEASLWSGFGNYVRFTLFDKTNAYRRGKRVYRMTFEALKENVGIDEFAYQIDTFCDLMRAYEETGERSESAQEGENYNLYFGTERAIEVAPISYEHIKPLKECPEKWSKTHVIRMLANGQFKNFVKKGQYTDDYAYDNAVGYREGEKQSADKYVKDLIERSGGWWFHQEGNVLSINCHHFNYNELEINI